MNTLIFDMYGVIIKESKGNFLPYLYSKFSESKHERITKKIREEMLYTRTALGEFTSNDFLIKLGVDSPETAMRDYIENWLTVDSGFFNLADRLKDIYKFALLSNDVSEWNRYILLYYNLQKYFSSITVSGNVGYRKPSAEIYNTALSAINALPHECLFIDNRPNNLFAAEKLGIKTVLFNRDNLEYNGDSVYSFSELEQYILNNL